MPTYDYVCEACAHAFEHFQSMTSRRLRKCPSCGERKLDRLVGSGAGVIFKGSGFYETDYKRSGQRPPETGPSESGGSEAGADASPSDSGSDSAGSSEATDRKKTPAKDAGSSRDTGSAGDSGSSKES
jgi:putative FmdB family regulatory protein